MSNAKVRHRRSRRRRHATPPPNPERMNEDRLVAWYHAQRRTVEGYANGRPFKRLETFKEVERRILRPTVSYA